MAGWRAGLFIFLCMSFLNSCESHFGYKSYSEVLFNAKQNIQSQPQEALNHPQKYIELVKELGKSLDLRKLAKIHETAQNAKLTEQFLVNESTTIVPQINTTDGMTTIGSSSTNRPTDSSSTVPTTPKPEPQVSALCQIHVSGIQEGIASQQAWAYRMVDAVGKPPANILGGGFTWLGDYDECLDISGGFALKDGMKYNFKTEYCQVGVVNLQAIPPILPKNAPIHIGMCLPDSCSAEDVRILVNTTLVNLTQWRFMAYEATCQEPDKEFDTRAIIVLIVIIGFILIMGIGTSYDIILIQLPKWQDTKRSEMQAETTFIASEKTKLIADDHIEHYTHVPGTLGKVLLSFSVYTNGSKLLNTDQPKGSLTAVNGIRFISMTWVILGHAYGFVLSDVDNVTTFLPKMMKRETFPAISNALVSVDTFFVLSGVLLVYLVMKELDAKNGKLNWGMFYFHRFWRLTPPYMLVLMVYVSLFPYTGSGPLWQKDGLEKNYCEDSWYYNLLYVNNFVDSQDQCFGWAWYLANDMQFFVLSPLIIVPLFFLPVIGFLIMLAFLIGTWVATGVMATEWNVPMSSFDGGDQTHWWTMYARPYFRMGPYLVGMLTGYIMYKTELKLRIHKVVILLCWIIAAVSACAVLYGIYEDVNQPRESREISSLYLAVHRTVWGAAVAWVIFACANGYGGYINTILSWKGFVPLARLTYCAYLVHPPIIYYYILTRKRMINLSDLEIIYEFLGHLCLSYAAAFIVSMAFEAPMMGLEKVVFKKDKKKQHK